MRYSTVVTISLYFLTISRVNFADDERERNINWVMMISTEAAHKIEPRNPIPKSMPKKLAEILVNETVDRHKLALLTVYAFAEGAYSLDPSLPGDCKGLPAGTPKCTTRMVEEGILCCDIEHARHWCTLQVEPKPSTLEECVQRASSIMQRDIDTCSEYPGSVYATGGVCGYSSRIAWRAKIAKHLEAMELP
jgi:hypothetical protein